MHKPLKQQCPLISIVTSKSTLWSEVNLINSIRCFVSPWWWQYLVLGNKCEFGEAGRTLWKKFSSHREEEEGRRDEECRCHLFPIGSASLGSGGGYDNISIRSDGKCVSSTLLTVLQVWDQHTVAESNASCHPLNVHSSTATSLSFSSTAKVIWPDWYQNVLINHSFQLHRESIGKEVLQEEGWGGASMDIVQHNGDRVVLQSLTQCAASLLLCSAGLNPWQLSPLHYRTIHLYIAFLSHS